MLSFTNYKTTDQHAKLITFGFIRKITNNIKLNNIPLVIEMLITLFYFYTEIYSIIGKNTKYTSNDKRAIKGKFYGGWKDHNYGITSIKSLSNAIYRWDIKIINDNSKHSNNIQIGVTSKMIQNVEFGQQKFYLVSNGRKSSHDGINLKCNKVSFCVGDEISFILDLQSRIIKIFINNSDRGVIFNNVSKSNRIKYNFVTSLYDYNDEIKIVNFMEKLSWKLIEYIYAQLNA